MARKQRRKQKARNKSVVKSSPKAKASARRKVAAKGGSKRKSIQRRPTRAKEVAVGSQSVETVPLRRRARAARAGAGAGDYTGVSPIEGADFESPKELLEEGQTFEAGIVSGVQNAPNADAAEVRTHEVPQDDVPEEYEDKDRP
jgi:hypothetical protein